MRSLQELEAEARRQHPEESDLEIARRVAYRAATLMRPPVLEGIRGTGKRRAWSVAGVAWQAVKILWAALILLLLGAIAVRAEEGRLEASATNAVSREEILAALKGGATGGATPAFDAPIIFLQDQTNQLAVIPAGKVIFNCSTNMACSWDSANRRFNMTASSTASTAFSALTASLNTNAGTFSASGNSWDFTAATLFKVRAGAGCTTSANGDLCFDTTNNRWKAWQTADRSLIASTNVGAAGQAFLSNADGSGSFADPLITYNQALLLNAVAATATQTSAAVTLSTRMAVGSLNVVGSGITGAPAGCTIAYRLSLAGVNTADIQSFAFTPGNNYQNFATTPSAPNSSADLMVAVYTCTTYPTAGTITVSFSPARSVVLRDVLTGDVNSFVGSLRVNLQSQTVNAGIDGFSNSNVGSIAPDGGGGSRNIIVAPFNFNGTSWDRQRAVVNAMDSTGIGIGAAGLVGQLDDTAPSTVTENQFSTVRITGSRGAHANLRNAAGTELGTAGTPLRTDPTGTTTQPIRGVGAVVADSTAVRCVNAANTAFESCAGAGGSGGTSSTDQAAFTAGTTSGTPAMGARDDTTPSTLAEDTLGIGRMTTNRASHVNLRNEGGTEIGSATTPVRTDPTGTTTQPVSGTVTANAGTNLNTSALALEATLGRAQGSTTSGQTGPLVQGAVTTSAPTYTTAQTNPLSLNTSGGLRTEIASALPTGTNNIGDVDVLSLPALPAGTNNIGDVDVLTFPDNEPFNVAQVAGTATSVNGGNIDAGTQRVAPARDAAVCNPVNAQQVAVSVSASGSTELVALTAGQTIYVCDVVLMAAGTVNVKLVYGTGTACATGPVDMTGALQHTAQTGWSNSPEGRLKTAAANALCINLSAAINVQGFITYRKAATF